MPRWITFDEPASRALRSRRIASDAIAAEVDWVEQALRGKAAVCVLPSQPGDVLVARFRRQQPVTDAGFEVARWTDDNAVGSQAGGMLGLLDEPVYEEEEPPKKKWWQRIVE